MIRCDSIISVMAAFQKTATEQLHRTDSGPTLPIGEGVT